MKNAILIKFGENVRALRAAFGISQEELAERADFHRSCVGNTEPGERNVAPVTSWRCPKDLGCLSAGLLKGSGRRKKSLSNGPMEWYSLLLKVGMEL
jgi:transcriptional regulator with XRE-family HTH domain